ncbi:outer membrane protein assembly factor BamB family protein [Actinomadura rudentiformis]|nr:PQQ-binding-like beta-propeller repeat protein [Actinomadura rudentiformis]
MGTALVMALAGCGGGSDNGSERSMLLRLDGRAVGVADGADPSGWAKPRVWATDSVVAVAGHDAVTGYAKDGRAKRWSVPLADVCGASADPVDGRVAVMLGSTPRCGRVALIDLRTGTKVWERTLGLTENVAFAQAVIGGEAVVARWLGGATALSIRDGRRLWNAQRSRWCGFDGFSGGETLVGTWVCRRKAMERTTVQRLHPRTGRVLWSRQVQGDVIAMPAAPQPVIGVGDRRRVSHFVVLDGKTGAERARIPLPSGNAVKCETSDPLLCANLVVGGGALYTKPSAVESTGQVSLVAFDLATGRRKWEPSGSGTDFLQPVGFEGGRLLAVREGTRRQGATLVELAPDTGRILARHDLEGPRRQVNTLLRQAAHVRYSGARLLVFEDLVTKPGHEAVRIFEG